MKGSNLRLKKTRSLLTRVPRPRAEQVLFAPDEGEGTEVFMPRAAWKDMGRPDEITVTVKPGDHLNV